MIFRAASVTSMAIPQNVKPDASAAVIPFCTVLSNASAYDGKEVTIKGVYWRVIHGSILTGPTCDGKANMRLSANWKGDKQAVKLRNSRARSNQGNQVVVRGTFRVAQQGCFGQTCSLYEIEESALLSAEVPSR